MEEIEVPVEKIQEDIHHQATHEGGHGNTAWFTQGALLSAMLAVLAAISALIAGHSANEAMIEQIRASDHWSHYQAKAIKSAILDSRADMLTAFGKAIPDELAKKRSDYAEDQKDLSEKAKERETASVMFLERHSWFAKAVTFFQIAIAITAIAVLVRRRLFLLVSIAFGLVGLSFFVVGLLH